MPNTETKEEKKALHKILQVLACSDLRKSLAEALQDGKSLTLSQLANE